MWSFAEKAWITDLAFQNFSLSKWVGKTWNAFLFLFGMHAAGWAGDCDDDDDDDEMMRCRALVCGGGDGGDWHDSCMLLSCASLSLHVVSPHSWDRAMSKRCSNLSTCALGKLSQELHKIQSFPRTDVGAGTPGKKRSLPESNHYASNLELVDTI